ncbi:hypothetical protein ABLE68_17185 [Nocardioides sp. CN2-186]|uniref:hypothetical protein n=1 Tax=Nocardioides tweenelious TaxID=3156607 RepID=UPI0032B38CF9
MLTLGILAVVPFLWARPRHDVAAPRPDATPIQVVATYLEALNARDFATSNKIPLPHDHNHLWSRPGSWGDVHDMQLTPHDGHDAHVIFSFTPHGLGGFAGGDDQVFGFYLDRIDGQWRITGYGVA